MIKPIVERVGDDLKINLFQRQAEFSNSEVDDLFFGGQAGPGKQLHVETLIPVPLFVDPSGFKKMGDIGVGDYVLSPSGHPVKVIWCSDVDHEADSYSVEFDTGETIVADSRHQWLTMTGYERNSVFARSEEFRSIRRMNRPSRALLNPTKPGVQLSVTRLNRERKYEYKDPPAGKIRTTKDILDTIFFRKTRINHSIKNTSPLHFQEQDLPMEPYLFGLWLGDGYSSSGSIGMLESDWREIEKYVPPAKEHLDSKPPRKNPFLTKRFPGMTLIIRKMGVLKNKHIPKIYLRASYQQRLSLLQGILDTDGTCSKSDGGIEIGFKSRRLIEDTHELICSLGIKCKISTRQVFCNGKNYGDFHRIVFVSNIPCFRLPRKFYRQSLQLRPNVFHRFIIGVKKTKSVPMRCIQVENEDGMYLVGRSFIPTHNSSAIIVAAAIRRMKYPGSKGLILRRTYPELEKSLIQKSREIYPMFGANYHEANKAWRFPNGSILYFGYCESDKDVFQFQSAEYQDIWFDEASHFTEFQISYITSRCRSTIPGCKPIIRLASNPGNIGHHYLKKRYIEPYKTNKIWTDQLTGKTLSFIPARLEDNPAMMELDPGYKMRLKDLGEQKYMALAEGSWEVSEGQYFDYDLRVGKGVLPYKRVPDSDTFKFLSMDWGYSEPACILWWELMPSGRIFIYRELYVTRLSPKELAQRIIEMSPVGEKYEYIACPPEIWGKKIELEGGGESIHDLMQTILVDKIPMVKASRERVAGWTKLREYFALAGDGRPWMQISPVCENLIRTIPTMIHDDKNPEDCSMRAEDHACLIGSATVTTRDGDRTLEELCGTEGEIWTDVGWKFYTGVQKTRSDAEVFKVTINSGESVVGTKEHRFMTPNGWRRIEELSAGSSIMIQSATWKRLLSLRQFKDSMESTIINAAYILAGRALSCIETYGNFIMARFRNLCTSTTGTMTDPTTLSKTWSVLPHRLIFPIILEHQALSPMQSNLLKRFVPLQAHGMEPRKGLNGTAEMQSIHGRKEPLSKKFVNSVAKAIRQERRAGLIIATLIAKCARFVGATSKGFVRTIESVGREDVYSLSVNEVHRYFVNGSFLSANSDSLRYGAMTLQNAPKNNGAGDISPYEQLFGKNNAINANQSFLPTPGRGGY
jgi:hypothetical protein